VTVPKAAVDENGPLLPLVREIGATRKAGSVGRRVVAQPSHGAPDNELDVGALAAHRLHHLTSFRWTDDIRGHVDHVGM
jgi:hypothetical protein